MLTPYEIAEARKQMVGVDWMREPWEDVVLAALDAYERVAALLPQITPVPGGAITWTYPPIHELLKEALTTRKGRGHK